MKKVNKCWSMYDSSRNKIVTSKDIKKKSLKLSKENYKFLKHHVNIQINYERENTIMFGTLCGIGYMSAGTYASLGMKTDIPGCYVASGALFLTSLAATGYYVFSDSRKEHKEKIKPLKEKKKEYKKNYKKEKEEIKKTYLEFKAQEEKLEEILNQIIEDKANVNQTIEEYEKKLVKKIEKQKNEDI